MGLFDGLDTAEVFERGNFFPPGFRGKLEIKKTIAKKVRKGYNALIVEFKVLEVHAPGDGYNEGDEENGVAKHPLAPVRVGEKRTYFQKLDNRDVALPAILSFGAALVNVPLHDAEGLKKMAPGFSAALDAATDSPAENDLIGETVNVSTRHTLTLAKKDFTLHEWSPSDTTA